MLEKQYLAPAIAEAEQAFVIGVGRHLQDAGDDERRQRQIAQGREALSQAAQQLMQGRLLRQRAIQFGHDQERQQQDAADPNDSRADMQEQAERQRRLRHVMSPHPPAPSPTWREGEKHKSDDLRPLPLYGGGGLGEGAAPSRSQASYSACASAFRG